MYIKWLGFGIFVLLVELEYGREGKLQKLIY